MRSAYRVSAIYALIASLWIFLSDRLIELFSDSASQLGLYSTVKGIVFVLSTSLMLFYLVRRELAAKNAIILQLKKEANLREELVQELHHRIKNNLQIAIGLVNLESREIASMDELNEPIVHQLNERIVRKLSSLSAVFNNVYNMKDMKAICLQAVLHEYEQLLGGSTFTVGEIDESINYSLETITSSLLLLDAIHELTASAGLHLKLDSSKEGSFVLSPDPGIPQELAQRIERDEFITTMLGSVRGTVEFTENKLCIHCKP